MYKSIQFASSQTVRWWFSYKLSLLEIMEILGVPGCIVELRPLRMVIWPRARQNSAICFISKGEVVVQPDTITNLVNEFLALHIV